MNRNLHSVKSFVANYRTWSEPALRDLIFKSDDRKNSRGEVLRGNGLADAGAILRIGRKVLIDEDRFLEWVDKQQQRRSVA